MWIVRKIKRKGVEFITNNISNSLFSINSDYIFSVKNSNSLYLPFDFNKKTKILTVFRDVEEVYVELPPDYLVKERKNKLNTIF